MALDFPASPVSGDIYRFESRAWRYNGRAWESINAPIVYMITNIDGGAPDENFGGINGYDGGGVD